MPQMDCSTSPAVIVAAAAKVVMQIVLHCSRSAFITKDIYCKDIYHFHPPKYLKYLFCFLNSK